MDPISEYNYPRRSVSATALRSLRESRVCDLKQLHRPESHQLARHNMKTRNLEM